MTEICGATKRNDSGEPCSLPAGWGTNHVGEGRCKLHGGASTGAPKNNQNRIKHGLYSDPDKYYESLSSEEASWVDEMAQTIRNRTQENRTNSELDKVDRELAHRIAVELHILSRAEGYIEENGLLKQVYQEDRSTELVEEVRRYGDAIFDNLAELGVFDHSKTITTEGWRDFLETGCGSYKGDE